MLTLSGVSIDCQFLSTLSLRRATWPGTETAAAWPNFYPRSPCGERPPGDTNSKRTTKISIHALLAESDFLGPQRCAAFPDFYPRSPCGERPRPLRHGGRNPGFLSTLSLRRATGKAASILWDNAFLSTLSLRRATTATKSWRCHFLSFLSTLSLRRATPAHGCIGSADNISIHALLAESDFKVPETPTRVELFLSTLSLRRATGSGIIGTGRHSNFYPRSPCGERLKLLTERLCNALFLSTLSLRRATAKVHKTVGHFCAYETNFMGIASSC